MDLKDFESYFLGISGENSSSPCVTRLYHTLLQKVEMDPYRQWTHDNLRNYIFFSYDLCSKLSQYNDNKEVYECVMENKKKKQTEKNTEKTEDVEKPKINIYEREDVEMSKTNIKGDVVKVYFTGLYTPGTYQGLKNGLYFVRLNDNIYVVTRTDIFRETQFVDVKDVLIKNKLVHRDSFENELIGNPALNIEEIISPDESNWQHILKDGIDNFPSDFIITFFGQTFEVPNPDERKKRRVNWLKKLKDSELRCLRDIMIETMERMYDNKHNLPVIFYKEEGSYNYLLPMYLQNSGKPDFCMVLRHKIEKGKYTGAWIPVTSLNMDEVYRDIRLFGKDAIERVRDWW